MPSLDAHNEEILQAAEARYALRRKESGLLPVPRALHKEISENSHLEIKDSTVEEKRPQKKSISRQPGLLPPTHSIATDSGWWVQGLGAEEMPESNASIPLGDYIVLALERNRESFESIYHDVDKTSGDPRFYRSPAIKFIALLKGRPEFAGLDGLTVAQWLDEALPQLFTEEQDPWSCFPDYDSHDHELDPRSSLIDSWNRVTEPQELETPHLGRARSFAERFPLISDRWGHPRDEPFKKVVALCYWFARLCEGAPFFLGCRDAGEFAGCSHVQANHYLKRAQEEGLLRLQKRGTAANREASEYNFNLDLVQFKRSN